LEGINYAVTLHTTLMEAAHDDDDDDDDEWIGIPLVVDCVAKYSDIFSHCRRSPSQFWGPVPLPRLYVIYGFARRWRGAMPSCDC